MGAMANMDLACYTVFAEGKFFSLIMCTSFCTTLLGMSPFWIWHVIIF